MNPLRSLLASLLLIPSFAFGSEVFFSPNGGASDAIIKRINLSQNEIDVVVYSFTSGEIAAALANAHKRGVKVFVIMDAEQSTNKNAEDKFLIKMGILLHHISGIERGIMHDKFAVFDGHEMVTGSYNWTNNAESYNHENALFTNEANIIKAYKAEFEKLWEIPEKTIGQKNHANHHRKNQKDPLLLGMRPEN